MSELEPIKPMDSVIEAEASVVQGLLPRRSITTHESWRAFVDESDEIRPPVLSAQEFDAAGSLVQRAHNEARKRYHARFGPLETPQLREVHEAALRLASLNYSAAPGVRPGIALDGLGTAGKSTIATHLGRKYERALRKRIGLRSELPNGNLFIPVVYISLPGDITIKAFNWLVVDYLGLPAPRSASEDWLSRQIVRVANDCGTSMFIVDDIHFVKVRNRGGETINNHFKYLASCISATFIYAGINLAGSQLLSEGASRAGAVYSQTKHRFKRFEITPYAQDDQVFRALLASFEHHLLLRRHKPGTLDQLADYIYARTGGFIGAVSTLLREAANLAIDTGEERLTRKLLSSITLDFAAEEHHAIASRRILTSRPGAARRQ
jgi:hypothetical protein